MKDNKKKTYSFKFCDDFIKKIEILASFYNVTKTDVIRYAVNEFYVKHFDEIMKSKEK